MFSLFNIFKRKKINDDNNFNVEEMVLEEVKEELDYVCGQDDNVGTSNIYHPLYNNFSLCVGDITIFEVDAIVNAANSSLLGGGGVDGAIHWAAGYELYEECKTLGGCKTGSAKMTKEYNLKAKHVIHTVGPIYDSMDPVEAERLLKSCYKTSLDLAKENNLHSIAFPCISTGVYGYPHDIAAKHVTEAIIEWLDINYEYDINITLVCFESRDYGCYKNIWS